jgi:hypothetical protein
VDDIRADAKLLRDVAEQPPKAARGAKRFFPWGRRAICRNRAMRTISIMQPSKRRPSHAGMAIIACYFIECCVAIEGSRLRGLLVEKRLQAFFEPR